MNDQTHTEHAEPNYMGIFWWLLVLTILEIGVALIPNGPFYSKLFQGFLLVGTAVGKATLVALYFMHLKFEKRILGLIALSPLILMIMALTFLLNDIRNPEMNNGAMSQTKVETITEN